MFVFFLFNALEKQRANAHESLYHLLIKYFMLPLSPRIIVSSYR